MTITPLEKETPLWSKIEREIHARLAILREKNDGNHTLEETNLIRGEIRANKAMLGWAIPPVIID